eukprot:CAMPEP_0172780122 /NCGR_PEP_ID=MMETSP1074-20121228/202767_1 /TAXON_ID=2916 /ORGANISM="Ceratium fusus, Strain PA161109" /LENGTH=466 /DNA_ID=CAMNT_0013617093 /DNA_START=24 /DNA_END=1424 /DNA_ORIENTATION=-
MKAQQLSQFLRDENAIDPKIVDFLNQNMRLESISDFAAKWENEKQLEEEVVAHVEPFKSNLSKPPAKLQLARVRRAWHRAQGVLAQGAVDGGKSGPHQLDGIVLAEMLHEGADNDAQSALLLFDTSPNEVADGVEDEEQIMEAAEGHASPKWLFRFSCLGLLLYWGTGYAYGKYRAGWDIVDSVYFLVVTISTVGYGDFAFSSLDNDVDKLFGAFYVFFGVVIIGVAAGIIIQTLEAKAEEKINRLREQHHEVEFDFGHQPAFNLEQETRRVFLDILWSLAMIGISLVIGTATMMQLENWCASDAFYFSMITITTVGYGDILPTNPKAKLFVSFYILFGFGVLANSLSAIGAFPSRIQQLRKLDKSLSLLGESFDAKHLSALCSCTEVTSIRSRAQIAKSQSAPYIDRSEFVLWQLLKQDKIQMDDIQRCVQVFDKLDYDGSGSLDQTDIDLYLSQRSDDNVHAIT